METYNHIIIFPDILFVLISYARKMNAFDSFKSEIALKVLNATMH